MGMKDGSDVGPSVHRHGMQRRFGAGLPTPVHDLASVIDDDDVGGRYSEYGIPLGEMVMSPSSDHGCSCCPRSHGRCRAPELPTRPEPPALADSRATFRALLRVYLALLTHTNSLRTTPSGSMARKTVSSSAVGRGVTGVSGPTATANPVASRNTSGITPGCRLSTS